jgi:hypothetical protein
MNPRSRLLALLSVTLITLGASAQVQNLFNTGIGNNGSLLADGTIGDPHYSLITVPSGTTDIRIRTEAGGYPVNAAGHWLLDDGLSTWIGPNNNSALDSPGGAYDYQTTFNLPSAQMVDILGRWATDNTGTDILLNGTSTGNMTTGGADGFSHWSSFVINAMGIEGINTLDFLVQNNGSGPSGLRVEIVPEPSVLTLAGIGVISLLAFASRQKRRAA